MRTFEIYAHPSRDLEAVKKGFSWPAIFFSWLWALAEKLWLVAFWLIVGPVLAGLGLRFVILQIRSPGLAIFLVGMAVIACLLFVGFSANNWKRSTYIKREYVLKRTLKAANPGAAIAKFGAIVENEDGTFSVHGSTFKDRKDVEELVDAMATTRKPT